MPRQLPPLNAIRAFEAAGRHSSFSHAAEELNVTHAAVSRHVRGLEHRLGIQLFRKVARGVELTDAGRTYLRAVTPALDKIADATEALTGAYDGLVSVSCEPTFAVKWLMPRLGTFQEQHPDIEVKIDSTPRLADIGRYECDLALRFCSVDVGDMQADLICQSPVCPVGAPDLLEKNGPISAPADLLQFRLLHEDKGQLWRRWFAKAGLPDVSLPRVPGELGSLLAIEAALSGQGLALMSNELVTNDIHAGRLVRFSDIELDFGGYHLLYLNETVRRRAVRAFRSWLLVASAELRSS